MKKFLVYSLLVLFCSAIVTAYALTGREIMEKSDALPEPKTAISKASMVIYKGGDTLQRTIELMAMKVGQNEKVLAVVKEEPSGDITKVLTHTHRGGEDLQWVKMPNGKVKRISSGDRSGAFVNSHIFYEDLRSRNIDDYEYTLLGEETIEGYQCYKIEAKPKPGKSIYDKAIFFIIKSGEFQYFAVRIDIFYDGYLYKRLINYNLKKVDGIITPYKAVMYRVDKNGQNLGRTEVFVTNVQYNNPAIKEDMFNQGKL
ncbi:MAG: outer membrane lipoprotein-sorting protein [Spirochaetes bacterium]|nr:outer membrane lipoprotein-sorting protein [Spirochaetota bacterium]